jgi:hypothetical protein
MASGYGSLILGLRTVYPRSIPRNLRLSLINIKNDTEFCTEIKTFYHNRRPDGGILASAN